MAEIEMTWMPLVAAIAANVPSTLDVLLCLAPQAPASAGPRTPLNVALVLDRSGSMGGPKLEQAKEAACRALELMAPEDRVSVVAFDDEVDVLVPSTRAADRAGITARIRALGPGGSTALCAGWEAGRDQVRAHLDARCLNRVILLSDGEANVGETNADVIATRVNGAERGGVSTSTLGLGDHYNEDLMEALARSGDGNYWHVDGEAELQPLVAAELQGLLALAGRKASLGIRSAVGVEVIDVLNELDRLPTGRWKLPNLMAGKVVTIGLRLQVPALAQVAELCRARVAFDDPATGKRVVARVPLSLPAVPAAALSEFPPSAAVREAIVLLEVARLRQGATRALKGGNREGALEALKAVLRMLAGLPASAEVEAERARAHELMDYLAQRMDERFSKKSSGYNFSRRRGL